MGGIKYGKFYLDPQNEVKINKYKFYEEKDEENYEINKYKIKLKDNVPGVSSSDGSEQLKMIFDEIQKSHTKISELYNVLQQNNPFKKKLIKHYTKILNEKKKIWKTEIYEKQNVEDQQEKEEEKDEKHNEKGIDKNDDEYNEQFIELEELNDYTNNNNNNNNNTNNNNDNTNNNNNNRNKKKRKRKNSNTKKKKRKKKKRKKNQKKNTTKFTEDLSDFEVYNSNSSS